MPKRLIAIIALATVLAGGAAFAYRGAIRDLIAERSKPELPAALPYRPEPEPAEPTPEGSATAPAPAPAPKPAPTPKPAPAPTTAGVNLAVPFTSQAPFANWDHLHEEACEETALIMVHAYLTGAGAFTPDEAESQIQAMVKWSIERFGYYEDQTAEEIAVIAREYYGHKRSYAVAFDSMDDVKKEIDAGRPVIIPSAGRMLHNPYFSGIGPLYHAIVVKGYTKDGTIITNDAGTRRGADYLYDPDVLFEAAHDWNGGDVEHGAKMMVVLKD
ncbi:MAG TPA: C39 family peptidase [Candidatus Baltobacteraceae bacterium]|nr:C39 family peptidase [Candidatus Baltobacteraceae bacterium]